jgi:adenylate kinase
MVNVVLLAPPGAGKGTQASIVAEAIGGEHLSTGELLRQAVREGTPYGTQARDYMNRGELVPDDIVLDMVRMRLNAQAAGSAFVLDGFPRNVRQARELDRALAAAGKQVDHAIYIDMPRRVLLERLRGRSTRADGGGELRRREDDRSEVVERRLEVNQEQTEPLREYYRSRQMLSEIDGDRPVAEVTSEILRALGRGPAKPDD